ncbi:MAG: NAD-dependent epimerase/dehydratase family protein, partial [Rickettsia endosymbiont of Ixodes persulcatus]|nr:NAD-dependent epimerase/dehydratase family protein [Rickettsia endosymbiont of Ixodes persulcatus]
DYSYLLAWHKYWPSHNLHQALNDPRVRIFEMGGDICQPDILNEAFKGADGVFHFAALWLLQCHEFPQSAFKVNIEGSFNVFEACVKHNVKRLVYSSSASVYGDAIQEPMSEDHPFLNTNFYGATKIAGEAMAKSYYHRYKMPFIGLRYMNVYGPRQDYRGAYIAVIMKILDNLDKGLSPCVYGDGLQAYDFVYVEDCAKANICAMQANTNNQFYNVGTGIRTTIKELVLLTLKITRSNLKIEYRPEGLSFVKNRIACTKKAAAEISFKAEVSLEEGLKRVIDWRRKYLKRLRSKIVVETA